MDDSRDIIRNFYDQNSQQEWDRLDRHPFEFAITTRMMDRYIKAGDSILDIGGGPGRYSSITWKRQSSHPDRPLRATLTLPCAWLQSANSLTAH